MDFFKFASENARHEFVRKGVGFRILPCSTCAQNPCICAEPRELVIEKIEDPAYLAYLQSEIDPRD